MKVKNLLAALSCSGSLVAGAAVADEPFVLSGESLDTITAAGLVDQTTLINKNVVINKNVNLNVTKNVTSTVFLTGNLATAEASADASGCFDAFGCLAETDTFAQATGASVQSFSESLAAYDPFGPL